MYDCSVSNTFSTRISYLRSRLWRQSFSIQSGFTVLELTVVVALIGILASIAVPSLSQTKGQMSANQEVRRLATDLAELRGEAIRLRTAVRLSFTSLGYNWDIGDDGSIDGNRSFDGESTWYGSYPSTITLNGLGLARGISGLQTIRIQNRGQISSLSINYNGHIKL